MNTHLTINYQKTYTDIRTGKLDYHEFMRLINQVYEYGFLRGQSDGIAKCQEFIDKAIGE